MDETSAFYLKHQNIALASELHQFKFNLLVLTKERQVRRLECRNIHRTLGALQHIWEQYESKFIHALKGKDMDSGNDMDVDADVTVNVNADINADMKVKAKDEDTSVSSLQYAPFWDCAGEQQTHICIVIGQFIQRALCTLQPMNTIHRSIIHTFFSHLLAP